MSQQVESLKLKDLVLWTENPRDPINANATDQEIVDKAILDGDLKWQIPKLAKEMGEYYDFSELPTIVYHGKKPVVYDGNRRIILGKIQHGLVEIPKGKLITLPNIPEIIPCNVCSKDIALRNVYRKHSDSGSWKPLERDIFLHKFMGEAKSAFLILEEETNIISQNPHLNKRFVKDEIFKEEILSSIGFKVINGHLSSVHSDIEAKEIFTDLSEKIKEEEISTRKNRGKVIEVLSPKSQKIIEGNKTKKLHIAKIKFKNLESSLPASVRETQRTKKKGMIIFGGKLFLNAGPTSDLYRDIYDLYEFYAAKKKILSNKFPNIIRMSLRLLCETASKEKKTGLQNYIKNNFALAKKNLDQNIKTTLSNQNVNESSLIQLLQTGAHSYDSVSNMEQTLAMSLIIGEILTLTHGKENK